MQTSETITKIATALLSVQNEFMVISHDKKGFTNSYASYESLIVKAKPILTEAGILLIQPLDHVNDVPVVETWLIHSESGEFFHSTSTIKLMSGAKLQEAQLLGGGISYTKRYALAAMLTWGTGTEDADQTTLDDSEEEKSALISEINEIKDPKDLALFYNENKGSKFVKDIVKACAARKQVLMDGISENT